MTTSRFKRCPFCGSLPDHFGYTHEWVVLCECAAKPRVDEKTEEAALKVWNDRYSERESSEESGWVIELAASEPCSPQYWAGSSLWVPEHLKAIRFARKQDAQQAADFMLDGMKIRICEHGWG